MKIEGMSTHALNRLPYYLNYLLASDAEKDGFVSSAAIATALNLNEVQVRKDLAACSCRGIPKKGFCVSEVLDAIRECLGHNDANNAILIGVGNLGRALMSYKGFEAYGLNIVAAFDKGKMTVDGKPIFDIARLPDIVSNFNAKIAIIAVPAEVAQNVCDIVTQNGILAVWNFAPTHLKVPDGVLVHNENMASSLAVLSNHLKARLKEVEE